MIYKWLAIAAISAAIAAGAYFKGRYDVTVVLELERAVHKAQYDAQVAETNRVQGEWDASKERENDTKAKLDTATADGASLAQRLRDHQRARRCPLPQAEGTGAESGATGEVAGISAEIERLAGEIERTTEEHFANCASDAEQLTLLQKRYNEMRDAQ